METNSITFIQLKNYASLFTVGLLAAACEIPLSWTSPMYPKLYSNDSSINPLGRPITENEDAWIGSLVTIGGLIGPFFFLFITDRYGRKPGLLCMAVPVMVSYFIAAFAKELYLFYIVRILSGISSGGCYALIPNYVAEISADKSRGAMSQIINIFWAFGNFLVYALGPFLSARNFNILLGCLPTVFFLLFLFFATESPYYLVGKERIDDATKVIKTLRRKDEEIVDEELLDIKNGLKDQEKASLLELITNPYVRRVFFICVILIMTQDLCGFSAILFYMQMIFEAAGMSLNSDTSSLIVAIFFFLSSFISPFFVDRTGRRILTIVSSFGMGVALVILGGYFFVKDVPEAWTWIPLASLMLYLFSFNFGISSIPYTLTSEMFPTRIKNAAATACPMIGWTVSFLTTNNFNAMNNAVGHAGTFWIFATFSFLAGIFSILFVPETKGKSFPEIQQMLETGPIIQISIISKGVEIEKVKCPI